MKRDQKLLLIFVLTLTLMMVEFAGGLVSRSLALISDAGHMLTDSLAILLCYLALRWSRKPPSERRTFGYHRLEIIIALVNGLFLLAVSGYIFFEAVYRFFHPQEIRTGILLAVAVIGFTGNLFGLLVLRSETHENLNIRGAFLHILADTLSSVGVVIGGVIIALTGWNIVDSLIGIMIGGIVLRGAVDLIMESGDVLMEATPRDVDMVQLRGDVVEIPGVRDFHDIHVWTIGSGRRALSGHLLTDNISTQESQRIICAAREILAERYGIAHTTLEVECESCLDTVCEYGPHDAGADGKN
jgi:cobalt-zinc-cadmium efflux system protein